MFFIIYNLILQETLNSLLSSYQLGTLGNIPLRSRAPTGTFFDAKTATVGRPTGFVRARRGG
jgi:hypothetical protein